MALEHSTSPIDNEMAKQNAITEVVSSDQSKLNQLSSWISATAAKATLVTVLTFSAPAAFSQTTDIAKNDKNQPAQTIKPTLDTAKNAVLKQAEEPIKDSVQYKAEREKLLKEWEELKKKEEYINTANEQLEMLSWPLNFFNKVQERWGVFTERDGKFARAWIAIIDKTEWLPIAKSLAAKARRLLVYISSQAPEQVITMN